MAWSGDEGELRALYSKGLPLYERAARLFADAVAASLRTIHMEPVAVTHRVKGYTSFRKKLETRDFNDITDVIGLRVIVLRAEEVRRAVEVIKLDFDPIKEEVKGVERGSGYRSHHLDLRIKELWTLVPNYRGMRELRFEVQIRTALMHAWAEVEHALYKPARQVPEELQRGFAELAEALRESDDTLDLLAGQLDE